MRFYETDQFTVAIVRENLRFLTLAASFVLFPDHRRLRRSSIRRFTKRFRKQRQSYQKGELSFEKMTQSVRCWIAHAEHGDTWRLRTRLFRDYLIKI